MNNFLFKRSFWGSLLIIIGGLWLVENIFDLNIPVFRILLSLGLILIGVGLIAGWRSSTTGGSQTMFGENTHVFSGEEQGHSVMFGEAHIDLTSMDFSQPRELDLRCMFGELRVKVPAGVSMLVRGEVSFGSLQTPDGSSTSFGKPEFRSGATSGDKPQLLINVACTFGSAVIFSVPS